MNEIQVFKNSELGNVRTIIENGSPLFCGSDVAKILGYSNPWDALKRHCLPDGIVKHEGVSETTNQYGVTTKQTSEMTFITEGNIYRLISHSKLPSAERFEKWVFDEVLPSIRKHGAYMNEKTLEEALINPDFLIRLATELKMEKAKRFQTEIENAEMKPKALFADAVATSDDSILIGQLSKLIKQNGYEIGQNRLFEWLRENKYLCTKGENYNMPTQMSMDQCLFEIKERVVANPDGSVRTTRTTKVTGKGQIYFVNKFCQAQ